MNMTSDIPEALERAVAESVNDRKPASRRAGLRSLSKLEDGDPPPTDRIIAFGMLVLEDPTRQLTREERIKRQQKLQREGNRCTGHCCRAFFGIEYYDTVRRAENHRRSDNIVEADECDFIAGMVVDIPAHGDSNAGATCVHYDEDTGNCGAYATRPAMCRDYPYGKPCEQPGCTWQSERPGPVVRRDGHVKLAVYSACTVARELEKYEVVAQRGDLLRRAAQTQRDTDNAALRHAEMAG